MLTAFCCCANDKISVFKVQAARSVINGVQRFTNDNLYQLISTKKRYFPDQNPTKSFRLTFPQNRMPYKYYPFLSLNSNTSTKMHVHMCIKWHIGLGRVRTKKNHKFLHSTFLVELITNRIKNLPVQFFFLKFCQNGCMLCANHGRHFFTHCSSFCCCCGRRFSDT